MIVPPLVALAELLLMNNPAGIAVYEGDTGNCLLVNQAFADMVGESVEAMRLRNIRSPAGWQEARLSETAGATLEDGGSRHREVTLRTSAGRTVSLDCCISRFECEGKPHLLLIASDVTAHSRAEQALTVREQELRTLIETVPDLIVRYDRELRRTYVNPAWEKASGLSAREVLNVPVSEIPKVPNPVHTEYKHKVSQVLETGEPQSIGFPWVNAHGAELYLEYAIVPEHDRNGEISGVLAVGRDLSERKRTEEALNRLNRELRAISDCGQVLVKAEDEQSLLDEVCRIICEEAGYRMSWVGFVEHDEAKTIRPAAWGGVEEGYLADARLTWADTERGRGPAGISVRSGTSSCIQDFASDPHAAPWREGALRRGYRSSISLPLKNGKGEVFGTLSIYSTEPNVFTSDEVRLMEELAGDLAFGIMVLRTRTDRERAEEALRESEERYRMVFESSPVSIWEEDFSGVQSLLTELKRQGVSDIGEYFDRHPETVRHCAEQVRIIDVNRAALALHGAATKEELFAGLVNTFTEESFDTFRQELVCLWSGGTEMERDAVVRTLAGEHRQVTVYFSVCPGYEETLAKVIVSLVDITERKRAEEEKLRSEQRLRLHADHSPLGFLEWDEHFRAIEWNAACERIFGYTREEAIGRHAKDLILPAEVHELADGIYQSLMSQRGGQHSINENVTKDGRIIICEWFNTTLIDRQGKAIGVASVCNDITGQKRMEEELAGYRGHLEDQVKKRTAELEEKNAELERLNKIFVGRELRMVELKEQIRALKDGR